MATQVQSDYLKRLLGIDLPASPPGGGSPASADPPGGAPGAPATDGPPLPATDTEIFFAKDSAALTPDDTKSLDAYAAAMKATTDAITATGYASTEGDPSHNAQLARDRAAAVKKYLVDHGIDATRITAEGHGVTGQFGEKDLPSNRRVMLAPKPKAAPAQTPPADAPVATPPSEYDDPPPADLPPPSVAAQIVFGQDPPADKGEPRDKVEKELTIFLKALQDSQKLRSGVRVTDRVRLAANALAKGTEKALAVDTKITNERFGRDPAELAHEIAALLPDFIPRENYNAFSAMKPKDIQEPEKFSIAGALAKVVTPAVKKAIGWLPDSIQKKITDSIEDGIVKGITKATEALLDQNKVDGATKEAILKGMEAAIKEKGEGAKQ